MLFYIVLYLFVILACYKYSNSFKLGYLLIFLLFFFAAFRGDQVGTDTMNYLGGAGLNRSLDFEDVEKRPEIFYLFAVNYLDANNISFRIIIFGFSIITFLFLYLACKNLNKPAAMICLVFLVMFYLSMFNVARQVTALSILLFGYTVLIKDQKNCVYKFVLIVFLATMFHASSLIALIVIPLKYFRFKRQSLSLILIVFFLLNTVYPLPLIEFLAEKFSDTHYGMRYADRMMTEGRSFIGSVVEGIKFAILLSLFKSASNDTHTDFSDNLFAFSIAVQILTANMNSDVSRIGYVFTIYQVIYLGIYFSNNLKQNKKKEMLYWAFAIYYSFFCLYNAYLGYGQVVPYYLEFKIY